MKQAVLPPVDDPESPFFVWYVSHGLSRTVAFSQRRFMVRRKMAL